MPDLITVAEAFDDHAVALFAHCASAEDLDESVTSEDNLSAGCIQRRVENTTWQSP